MQDIRNILVTTDFSETSKKAVAAARTLATRFGASITLVHVTEDYIPPMVLEYMAESVEDVRQQTYEHAKKQLDAFARAHFDGFRVDVVIGVGIPHVEIVEAARSRSADVIVIATHGRGFISHAILGSTAERVIRRAECPVLVVRGSASGD
jgi:nucleotide-binding universal stress UspA family protein